MKKIYFPLLALFVSASFFAACQTSAEKVQKAEANVEEAQANLDKVRKDSVEEYRDAKAAWTMRIENNERTIAAYKLKVAEEKKEQREKDEAQLAALEKRNADLKEKMDTHQAEPESKWELFKADFSNSIDEFDADMQEFGKAFSDLGRK